MISVDLPIRAVSCSNLREHWAKRAKRTAQHRGLASLVLTAKDRAGWGYLPCTVRLVRIAPRQLDDDNLRPALKATRDGVADWLGIDDRDPRVRWEYGQERGAPKHYAVRVEVSGRDWP